MDRGAWQAYSPWHRKESDMTEVTGQSVSEFPHHYHTLTNITVFLCARHYIEHLMTLLGLLLLLLLLSHFSLV